MNHTRLQAIFDPPALLTPALNRQLALMFCWWEGWSLARMSREHGISRVRVAAILAEVGCRGGHRPNCFREWGSTFRGRGAPAARIALARALLLHPKASRLTVRQRAATSWTAMGLSSRDIAKRMGVTGQRVRSMLIAAEMRLHRPARRPATHDTVLTDHTPMPTLRWDGFLESLTGHNPAHMELEHAD